MVPVVDYVKQTYELAQECKNTKSLIKVLKSMNSLPPVSHDMQASEACLRNNRILYERDEEVPTRGGNIVIY
jgi:hypothetical protein